MVQGSATLVHSMIRDVSIDYILSQFLYRYLPVFALVLYCQYDIRWFWDPESYLR